MKPGKQGVMSRMKKPLPDGEIVCVVPVHNELKIGTLSGVLKQAKVTPDEFIANL
jgi:predicted RNA binding protein YcfA (HicA-like mRNA interferase family)